MKPELMCDALDILTAYISNTVKQTVIEFCEKIKEEGAKKLDFEISILFNRL